MTWRTLGISMLGTAGLLALSGCKQESSSTDRTPVTTAPQAPSQATAPATESAPEDPPLTGGGTVKGTVSFKGAPPAAAALTPSQDPACQDMPLVDQAVLVADGKLGNVLVRVRGLMPNARRSRPVVVDQHGCTYSPRVQGAVTGQPVLIKNSDGTLHNARALSGTKSIFNVAQPPNGKPVQRALPPDVEVLRLKCDIHPWMTSWVLVNPNPFFATTDAKGAFTLEHLPAGAYTLEAWHETFGTKTTEVTVKEGETSPVSFEFSAQDAKAAAQP
jgi:hypothetical protein